MFFLLSHHPALCPPFPARLPITRSTQALLQALEDAGDDVMMAEDSGSSKLLIGDIFFDAPDDDCTEHINTLKEVSRGSLPAAHHHSRFGLPSPPHRVPIASAGWQ